MCGTALPAGHIASLRVFTSFGLSFGFYVLDFSASSCCLVILPPEPKTNACSLLGHGDSGPVAGKQSSRAGAAGRQDAASHSSHLHLRERDRRREKEGERVAQTESRLQEWMGKLLADQNFCLWVQKNAA